MCTCQNSHATPLQFVHVLYTYSVVHNHTACNNLYVRPYVLVVFLARWWGGGGTPLHKPYRYVPAHLVGFLCCFCLKTGIDFAHFGLESGMVFKGIIGTYE